MRASEIRRRFLEYFRRNGHAVLPSSSLVPEDDPTLLFTNAGMVQFKRVFLGQEQGVAERRATTSQKCVRAGGKHNDLEQVGHTHRHHTFFEMLGNFSFGDYFKRDAIRFAWEFVTGPRDAGNLGLDPRHIRVSVFREDDEARALWREVAGLTDSRIYGLDEKDNFWQMADTGPCGPCSEIYIDLAHVVKDWHFPPGANGEWTEMDREEFSRDAFVKGGDEGRFLEFWNLVFMQFDKQPDGTLVPLPKPSVDTGAGLERISAFMQGVTNNYHTDLFAPLIATIERVVGIPYEGRSVRRTRPAVDPAGFRVVADHARAVAFLLADGVFPSNEGRGYVLRRILRRAVRHAWLLGRRAPTLVHVVETVVETMADVFPELAQRRRHILETTSAEEERFLATIDGGMRRFDEIAPVAATSRAGERTVRGEDAFRLYDTFGFPIDLTELMARERGYAVDLAGFESALAAQRVQSQEERKSRKLGVATDATASWVWETPNGQAPTASIDPPRFVGYGSTETETVVTAWRRLEDDRVALVLNETPFYAESGGQVSDAGEIVGSAWSVSVDDVRKVDGRIVAMGRLSGTIDFGAVVARVPAAVRRDTERNHTATHLLHAALRAVLGEQVHQAGSLVAPGRLRFDFTHHGPVKPDAIAAVEDRVNEGIWAAIDVGTDERPYKEAVAAGAMALFGEKYGDVVRVVNVPGVSVELCGGTHVRNTAQIALFTVLSETGVAAGVRRIEAATGPRAFEVFREHGRALQRVGELVRSGPDGIVARVQGLLDERRQLEKKLEDAVRGGGGSDLVRELLGRATQINGARLISAIVAVADVKALQAAGDALREQLGSGVAALGATLGDGKTTLLVVSTDDMRDRGVRADLVLKELAAAAGGRGGGKPHMAQAGIPDAARLSDGLARLEPVVRSLLGA
jgi:alanyl-tRNA synthetase